MNQKHELTITRLEFLASACFTLGRACSDEDAVRKGPPRSSDTPVTWFLCSSSLFFPRACWCERECGLFSLLEGERGRDTTQQHTLRTKLKKQYMWSALPRWRSTCERKPTTALKSHMQPCSVSASQLDESVYFFFLYDAASVMRLSRGERRFVVLFVSLSDDAVAILLPNAVQRARHMRHRSTEEKRRATVTPSFAPAYQRKN